MIIRRCVRTLPHFHFFRKRSRSPSLNPASTRSCEPSHPLASRIEATTVLSALRQKRLLSALFDRGVVIWRSVMRSLYRGLFIHLDSLWPLSYLAITVLHVCFSKVSRPRDASEKSNGILC